MTSGHKYEGAFHFSDGADEAMESEYNANGNMTKDLNWNISQIQYNLLNLTMSKIGGGSKIQTKTSCFVWNFTRLALSLPSMVKFGDNHYIYHTYSAAGEKLMTQYQFHMLPVHAPVSSEGETQEADSMSRAVAENTRSGPAAQLDTDHIYYCCNVVYDQGHAPAHRRGIRDAL